MVSVNVDPAAGVAVLTSVISVAVDGDPNDVIDTLFVNGLFIDGVIVVPVMVYLLIDTLVVPLLDAAGDGVPQPASTVIR